MVHDPCYFVGPAIRASHYRHPTYHWELSQMRLFAVTGVIAKVKVAKVAKARLITIGLARTAFGMCTHFLSSPIQIQ